MLKAKEIKVGKGKEKKTEGGKELGEGRQRWTPGRVGTSHVIWPKPVSGVALVEAGDDGPRHGYRS